MFDLAIHPFVKRECFPASDKLALLTARAKQEGRHLASHESIIQHQTLANHVHCERVGDKNMATIFTNVVMIKDSLVRKLSRDKENWEMVFKGIYEDTCNALKSVLNKIPGFYVEVIGMMPNEMVKWFISITENLGEDRQESMVSGNWIMQYRYDESQVVELRKDLIAADFFNQYVIGAIKRTFYLELDNFDPSSEDSHEILKDMVYREDIQIIQHPYSKQSFSVAFNKQVFSDRIIGPSLAAISHEAYLIQAGLKDNDFISMYLVQSKDYLGSWWAAKLVSDRS